MTAYRLTEEILKLSESKEWSKAVKEWKLKEIYLINADEPTTCLCGHYPVYECCIIKNTKNNFEALVGNCCVKKFLGLNSNSIFISIKKVRQDIDKSFNPDTLRYAFSHYFITEREFSFYKDIMRKRNLSEAQLSYKVDINTRILRRFRVEELDNTIGGVQYAS